MIVEHGRGLIESPITSKLFGVYQRSPIRQTVAPIIFTSSLFAAGDGALDPPKAFRSDVKWEDGSVHGLKARGGFEIGAVWKDGKLVSADVVSQLGNPAMLRLQAERVR